MLRWPSRFEVGGGEAAAERRNQICGKKLKVEQFVEEGKDAQ